jgi:hypothetical protein
VGIQNEKMPLVMTQESSYAYRSKAELEGAVCHAALLLCCCCARSSWTKVQGV